MTTWVLILTLYAAGFNNASSGQAIHSVPGFKSPAQCQAAAKAWMDQVPKYRDGDAKATLRTLCVQQ